MRDRSEAQVGGNSGGDTGPHGSGLPPAGVAPGGGNDMASALAAALSARNKKVSHSGKFYHFLPETCPFFFLYARPHTNLMQMTRAMMTSGIKFVDF